MPAIHIFLENYLWKVLRNYLLILMRNRVFKLCFSKVFTSFLFCFVYDKQRFNIVGFFVSKYVFYNVFSVFFNRYLFSPITSLYFDSCNLCKKKPLSLKRFIGLRLFISRSSRLQMLYNRYIFRKIYDKTRVSWSLFHKVAELEPATVLKRRLQNRVFPCGFFEKSRSNFL